MKNWKKLAEKMLKNMDRQKWIVCILIGVLLLVIAIPVDSKKQDAGTQESVQTTETESSSYVEQMERELEDLLGQMDGVGAVRVMISLKIGGECRGTGHQQPVIHDQRGGDDQGGEEF